MTSTELSAENGNGTRREAGNSGISLADLKSRRVLVEWFEAVAIVQGSCRALLESRVDPDKTSLAPKDVFIDPAGNVRFAENGAEKVEPAIRQIGELLRTSLAESQFPVQLRLVITQACSTVPSYASIAELSSALEYFERPDRTGLIRSVYERAQGHQALSGAVTQDTPEPEAEKPALQDKLQPRRISRSAIAVSAAAGTAIVLWLAVSQLSTGQQGNGPVAEIVASVGALVDRVNPFKASSSPEAQTPAPESPRTNDASPRRNSARAGGKAARSSPQAVQPAPDAETPRATDVSSGDALPTSDAIDTKTVEAFATEEAVDAVAEAMIYSANDRDVTPPVAAYPRLPAEPPTRIPPGDLSTLELLVDETGQVESVKFLWRFLPAVKDGRPVKYRTLVQVWPTTQ